VNGLVAVFNTHVHQSPTRNSGVEMPRAFLSAHKNGFLVRLIVTVAVPYISHSSHLWTRDSLSGCL